MNKFSNLLNLLIAHKGISISSFAHIFLFALLLFNFSQCQSKKSEEIIISIDLLPIAKETNIENKQNKKKSEKEIKPIIKPKTEEKITKEIKEEKPEPKVEPKVEPKKEIIKNEVVTKKDKIEKKKIEVPKTKPVTTPKKPVKKKPKTNEYDALLKTLEDLEEHSDQDEVVDKTSKGKHNPAMSLSFSVKDSIKKQIEQCWSPPAGNKDAGKLQVLLDISFKPDGTVSSAKVINNNRYSSDEMYRVAADAAMRAVYKCSPLQGLPVDQYKAWERIEFNFDPSEMIY